MLSGSNCSSVTHVVRRDEARPDRYPTTGSLSWTLVLLSVLDGLVRETLLRENTDTTRVYHDSCLYGVVSPTVREWESLPARLTDFGGFVRTLSETRLVVPTTGLTAKGDGTLGTLRHPLLFARSVSGVRPAWVGDLVCHYVRRTRVGSIPSTLDDGTGDPVPDPQSPQGCTARTQYRT